MEWVYGEKECMSIPHYSDEHVNSKRRGGYWIQSLKKKIRLSVNFQKTVYLWVDGTEQEMQIGDGNIIKSSTEFTKKNKSYTAMEGIM